MRLKHLFAAFSLSMLTLGAASLSTATPAEAQYSYYPNNNYRDLGAIGRYYGQRPTTTYRSRPYGYNSGSYGSRYSSPARIRSRTSGGYYGSGSR